MLVRDKTVKKACLADVAISNSRNLHSTTAKKLQNYRDLKQLIRMRQLKTADIVQPVLSTTGISYFTQMTRKFKTA
jgi:hypothetical protein